MKSWLAGLIALIVVTVREAQRQRLWALFLGGMATLVILAPSLKAVDQADRLKLAIVAQSGVAGFVVVLLAILLPAAALRRDLESRVGFMLFSKPLARSAYLIGRWSGVQFVLLIGALFLCLIGTATIAWQFGGIPSVRRVIAADRWEQVSAFGQDIPITEDRRRVTLNGLPGGGVRWYLSGLPASDREHEVLIKVRLRGYDIDDTVSDLEVQVSAAPDVASLRRSPQVLALDPASPYGHQRGGALVAKGRAVVRDREAGRTDLAADYVRLRLPLACVLDGSTVIQLNRLEPRAALVAERTGSCLVAVPGGSFFGNLSRGALVQLAGAGLLAAWALLLACVASLGVAFLGGLTLFIGGAALPAVREVLSYDDSSLAARRIMELMLTVFPDFDRFGAAPRLAAGQEVPWSAVGDAWLHALFYIILFLGVAWWSLRRKEL